MRICSLGWFQISKRSQAPDPATASVASSAIGLSHGSRMRFVIVFTLATIANFLWGGYISAVSGKQAVRAAAWSMAIAIVGGVIAINFVRAPVLLVSLAAGSFVGTYLSIVSDPLPCVHDFLAVVIFHLTLPPRGTHFLGAPGNGGDRRRASTESDHPPPRTRADVNLLRTSRHSNVQSQDSQCLHTFPVVQRPAHNRSRKFSRSREFSPWREPWLTLPGRARALAWRSNSVGAKQTYPLGQCPLPR